jgi:hypothetical protein
MRKERCLGALVAIILTACSGNPTSFLNSRLPNEKITQSRESSTPQTAGGKAEPTLYVFNEPAGHHRAWVSVYANLGASLLRKVPADPKPTPMPSIATDTDGHFFITSGESPGLIKIYSNRGAKLAQTLQQRHGFGVLLPDRFGNLYAACKPGDGHACEYAPGNGPPFNPKVARKLDSVGAVLHFAVDASGDLGVGAAANGFYAYAPGQTQPYWSIEDDLVYLNDAFDSAGNLYVITYPRNSGVSSQVSVYAPGASSPERVLSDANGNPMELSFDGSGNLYVLNYCTGSCSVPHPTISVFAPGGSEPLRTITSGFADNEYATMAVDQLGDIAVAVGTGFQPSSTGSF